MFVAIGNMIDMWIPLVLEVDAPPEAHLVRIENR